MKVKDILRVDNWCKGAGALDHLGKAVGPRTAHACKFCLAGALYRCYEGNEEQHQLGRVAEYILAKHGCNNSNAMAIIVAFNDYQALWSDIENIIKELEL